MTGTGFFAYPGGQPMVSEAVKGAVERSQKHNLVLQPWETLANVGFKIDNLIRDTINECDFLVADITYQNFNVLYEMGYAIAIGKPVIPALNVAVQGATRRTNNLGLFDTTGWATYENGDQLCDKLTSWQDIGWTNSYIKPKDHSQPLFLLDCQQKTDFRNHIVSAIENSHVRHRAFDPSEVARLTAAQAIAEISSSAGAIIPILDAEITDSVRHNLRAAFLIGLAHGYELDVLAIQFGHGPAPLDYRDFITNSTYRKETVSHVERYCAETLIRNQDGSWRSSRANLGMLGQIDLGSPVAEYETQHLHTYFVKTSEYARAVRAEGAVIAGRKGAGKSAIYLQLASEMSRDKRRCIVDLRPASHNLSEMRESLLSIVAVGVFDHTIAAFWQYVLLVEVVLKIRELVLPKSRNDFQLQERIRKMEQDLSLDDTVVSGDFTSRLSSAIDLVVGRLRGAKSDKDVRESITNIMFERPIPNIRDCISSFKDFFDEIVILIDDLDKGWPPLKVEPHDVSTIKHLFEVLNRVKRDVKRRGIDFRHLVFLRSDVYDQLVEQTSDRGKYNLIKVDWYDPIQLRNLLQQRVRSGLDKSNWDDAWSAINPDMSVGDAVDYAIDCSLRRPRFLIDLMERVLSFSINRGHAFVTIEDVEEGARQMSLYLVSDFAYEMRDIAGTPEDIFYAFIGVSSVVTHVEVALILKGLAMEIETEEVIELLLWYGFLGVVNLGSDPVYIYDRAYDFRRLLAERGPVTNSLTYSINPAFLTGLTT